MAAAFIPSGERLIEEALRHIRRKRRGLTRPVLIGYLTDQGEEIAEVSFSGRPLRVRIKRTPLAAEHGAQ